MAGSADIDDAGKGETKESKQRPIKLILRRLPPGFTSDELRSQIEPLPSSLQGFRFASADTEQLSRAFSRAYIVLTDEQEAIGFCERFNGYVFVDSQGRSSTGIVELAPNQVVSSTSRDEVALDLKIGTIDTQPEFVAWKELDESVGRSTLTIEDQLRSLTENANTSTTKDKVLTPLTKHLLDEAGFQRLIEKFGDRSNKQRSSAGRPTDQKTKKKKKAKKSDKADKEKDGAKKPKRVRDKKPGGKGQQASGTAGTSEQPAPVFRIAKRPTTAADAGSGASKPHATAPARAATTSEVRPDAKPAAAPANARSQKERKDGPKPRPDRANDAKKEPRQEKDNPPKQPRQEKDNPPKQPRQEKDNPPKQPKPEAGAKQAQTPRAPGASKKAARPERELYQPGARNRQNRGAGAAAGANPSEPS